MVTAASYEDVVEFFKKYYAPSNASLVVAGDFDSARAKALVEKWFADVKPAPPAEPITMAANVGTPTLAASANGIARSRFGCTFGPPLRCLRG